MKEKERKIPILAAFAQEGAGPVITDPQGSYTGVPEDPYETPVQDADDL